MVEISKSRASFANRLAFSQIWTELLHRAGPRRKFYFEYDRKLIVFRVFAAIHRSHNYLERYAD